MQEPINTLVLRPTCWQSKGSYKTPGEAKAAWMAGKDFKIRGGPYCSIRDISVLKGMYDDIVIEYRLGFYTHIE